MSHRLSILSSISHVDRRTLPPMRSSQPDTRRLRTWVYKNDDGSCSTHQLHRIILRVGQNIAIFPDDVRAVPMEDGSLPIMSYWYGKIAKIYLKKRGDTHDVWLDIQWYYRRLDLEDNGVDLAQYMGEYELVLSDHTSLVDMTCVEDHALIVSQLPPETLYHRWNVEITFVKKRTKVRLHGMNLSNPQRASQCRCAACDYTLYCPSISQRYCRKCKQWFSKTCLDALDCQVDRRPEPLLPSTYDHIVLPEGFLAILTMPICRGGPFGVVGNGSMYCRAKLLLREARTHGNIPEEWKNILVETESWDLEADIEPTYDMHPKKIV
ncbi:hypothetical protein DEU56DRAFT_756338 [Suillus clintonianus]|uniref:uncharacterized protein n=1 Tax=Suillus clintonianus TaxID=1904413 RepID=UPI001B866C2B|nr:uncharacterized protein DEU56DRAFT_756338 [Suillus clintonianus]KAG2136432.1 hypothetical protein DEU56DRAFT_756338 [Suillus clintonianus]